MTESTLGVDQRSLDSLRLTARSDPQAAVKQAAEQFEALFMRQLLKSMRDSIPRSGFTDSAGERMAQDLLDDQMVSGMVGAPGGLGATIARHLSKYMPGGATPEVAGVSGAGSALALPSTLRAAAVLNPLAAYTRVTGATATLAPANAAASPNAIVTVTQATDSSGDESSANDGRFDLGALPGGITAALNAGRQALMNSREGRFVDRLWPHAVAAEQATGVPAAFVVGQAALESGWGGGEMRRSDGTSAHNLFGIKAGSGWQGETVDVMTTEYIDGQRIRQVERFRAYDSYESAFTDWISLMTRHPRYRDVLRNADSAENFANGLQSAGYATDPQYGDKLHRVIQRAIEVRAELT